MRLFLFAFLVVGFSEIVGQVLLIRELIINFQGNELSLGVILANWLLLIAVGSWGLGRFADRLPTRASIFVITQILFCLILPAQLLLARTINNLIGIEPGEIVALIPIFYSSLMVLAPLCILHGFQFALGCRILAAGRKNRATQVGRIYVAEATGGVAGGVAFTYLLVHYLHPFEIALFVVLLNLTAALFLLKPWAIAWRANLIPRFLVCLVVLASVLGIHSLASGNIDSLHEVSRGWQWRGYNLIHHQDSVYGNIAVTHSEGQSAFFASGLLMFTTPDPNIIFIEEVAHFPLLYHPSPQRVLLIGGGVGGVLDEILKHPTSEVHYVELDPLIIEVAREHSPARALDDPGVWIEYTDGRLFVRHTQEKYDVIIVNLPPPSTLQLNRYYTKEFFTEVYDRLSPGGIFSFGIPASEAYMSREMISHNRGIYETLNEVFPSVSIIPGEWWLFLASPEATMPTHDLLETISRRFQARNLETSLFTVPYIEYKLCPERIARLLALAPPPQVEINRDLQPIGTYYNLALWNVMLYPGSRGFFDWVSGLDLWWFAIPLGLLLIIPISIRWRRAPSKPMRWPVALAIMTTGFAGMTFSIISLLAFQTLHGYLYQKMGILIAAFMLGLALGGWCMNHIMNKLRRDIIALGKIELAIIAYSLLLPLILILLFAHIDKLPLFIPAEVPLLLLNCVAGFLVGLQFPLANKIYLGGNGGVGRVAGTLYGSDLFGAIFGALLASVFLIPILGIPKTCLVIAMFKLASLVLLIALPAIKKEAKP
ncbi:MAG TPA: hypothetical protein DCY61_05670 [Dehalococcoidia bacterium]|nr:hypothetical protein [Dehalococcoidia bacterium]